MSDWAATEAQAEHAIKMLKRMIDGAENGNQAADNCVVTAYAFARMNSEMLENQLSDIISDSLDMDWSPTDGAKAIVRRMVHNLSVPA